MCKLTAEMFVFTIVDVIIDTSFSSVGYYYNDISNDTIKAGVNAIVDGITDIYEYVVIYNHGNNMKNPTASNYSAAPTVSNTRNYNHLTFMERRMNGE